MNRTALALGTAAFFAMMALPAQHADAAICTAGSSGDLSLTIGSVTSYADRCADGVAQGGGTAVEAIAINTALGTSLAFIAKSDKANSGTGTLSGIDFTVDTDSGNSGGWTLSWADVNGSTSANLPLTIDLAIGIFGGNNGAAYWFDDLLLPASPTSGAGQFKITFTNNGGQNPAISHLDLLGGNLTAVTRNDPDPSSDPVPEPMTLALLAGGLFGLHLALRRRRTV